MRPCGGVLGTAVAAGGGTEHQGHGTPHLHVQTHVVSIYQFGTMADIVAALRAQKFRFEDLAQYQQWFHAENIFDEPVRQEMSETINQQWHTRFADKASDDMSQTPTFLVKDSEQIVGGSPLTVSSAKEGAESLLLDARGRRQNFQTGLFQRCAASLFQSATPHAQED